MKTKTDQEATQDRRDQGQLLSIFLFPISEPKPEPQTRSHGSN